MQNCIDRFAKQEQHRYFLQVLLVN